MDWYLAVLKNYVGFSGRARRREYWMFFLINILIAIALTIVDNALTIGFIAPVYSLVLLPPTLAVTVRRLHDTGRTGWWILIGLVPIIGTIALLVFLATDGKPGDNRFGSNPS